MRQDALQMTAPICSESNPEMPRLVCLSSNPYVQTPAFH
jgi:hypothetical protein